jgi:tRNA 2-thiocytidine biosynthesis protein TtcA
LPKFSKTYALINRLAGKAIHDYAMIDSGDRIAVGLSGGKDSLTLLHVLNERQKRIPVKYQILPIYIDPGFPGSCIEDLKTYCRTLGYELIYELTDHGLISHSSENRHNPCFLCSRLRRKRLFEIARDNGIRKLALGHHKDDIIETMFINMMYSGHISTMVPKQPFFNGDFYIIRPLAYIEEKTIVSFSKQMNFPVFQNNCPSSSQSKRSEIKEVLTHLYGLNPNVKGNLFRSMSHVRGEYLLT